MARVYVENLTKKFFNQTVIDNFTLEVKDGSFVSLLGPPGAGKTTILRCIAGLETPDSGNIYIGNEKVNDIPPQHRDVALLFQSYALYPHMTVFENIAFPLKKAKIPKDEIEQIVKETSSLLGIDKLLHRNPGTLSGGEKQRVALARIMARRPRPKVILLDEPLTNLDAKLRVLMRVELRKIQKLMKQTAIFSTPDDLEAIACEDEIAVIDKGKLMQYGHVRDVYNHPRSLSVAQFVGTPPINIIDSEISMKDDDYYIETSEFTYNVSKYHEFLRDRVGNRVLFGIRPENISLSLQKGSESSIEVEVYAIEPLGAEEFIDVRKGEYIIRAKAPPTFKVNIGDRIYASFDIDRIHLFDKSTGAAIL